MPYYHVRLTPKSDPSKQEVSLDLTLQELTARFIDPYNKGQTLMISGKAIAADDVDRILITTSEDDATALRARLRARQREMAENGVIDFRGITESQVASQGEDVTSQFISGPPGSAAPALQATQESQPSEGTRNVFVVHGRNTVARDAMFQFLRSIDLHPLEWSEAARLTNRPSPYIGEILTAAFSNAHAVVVLFTPDDEARLRGALRSDSAPPHEAELTGQARPNVLFEAGMAFGRDPDRTVLVELGQLRPFTDISGIHVVRLDGSSVRRQELALRLRTAGCPISLDGTDWHSAGDFEAALALSRTGPSPGDDATGQGAAIHPKAEQLSNDAEELLIEASKDQQGAIFKHELMNGQIMKANYKEFGEMGNRRSEAKWKQALDDLLQLGLVEYSGGEMYQITQRGFDLVDELGQRENR